MSATNRIVTINGKLYRETHKWVPTKDREPVINCERDSESTPTPTPNRSSGIFSSTPPPIQVEIRNVVRNVGHALDDGDVLLLPSMTELVTNDRNVTGEAVGQSPTGGQDERKAQLATARKRKPWLPLTADVLNDELPCVPML